LGNGLGVYIWFTSHPHRWQLPQPVNKLLLNLLLFGFQGKLAEKFHQITACFAKTHVAVTLFLFSFLFYVMTNFGHFMKNQFLKRIFCHKIPKVITKKRILKQKKSIKVITIAYNMKAYLRFFYFHILNIAKFG
jgi:hypothetical protein